MCTAAFLIIITGFLISKQLLFIRHARTYLSWRNLACGQFIRDQKVLVCYYIVCIISYRISKFQKLHLIRDTRTSSAAGLSAAQKVKGMLCTLYTGNRIRKYKPE